MAISDLIAETIAQYIIAPKVLSYAPSKLNEVTGRFVSSNRVYNFVLNKSGVSYSPAGQGDSLLFSALYLRQDAVRKPKVGSDRCNAGKSYQCGKICLGNRRKCHKGVKDVNDARRIASILEGTNEKLKGSLEGSDKAKARGKALFEARKGRVEKPKAKPDDTDAFTASEFSKDLNERDIYKAYYFSSFSPDRRAKDEVRMYGTRLESDYNMLKEKAVTPELKEELKKDFEEYRQGYKKKYLEWLKAEGKTASAAVTGSAKFNHESNNRKQSRANDLYSEKEEYRSQALKKLKQKMTDTAPIKSGQSDAIEKIQKKIEGLQAGNELSKKYNAVLRKTKGQPQEDRIKALVAAGVSEEDAKGMFKPSLIKLNGEPWGWSTDGNNAEIRRYKQRIKDIESANEKAEATKQEQAKNREAIKSQSGSGGEVVGYEKSKHSKTGEDLHVAKMSGDRVSKEQFTELKAKAKTLGGYYSSYTKGFVFPDDSTAKSFARMLNPSPNSN